MSAPLLEIRDVAVEFGVSGGTVRALDGVSLTVNPGETVAVVGESGCGKTTLARAVLGLQSLSKEAFCWQDRKFTAWIAGPPRRLEWFGKIRTPA